MGKNVIIEGIASYAYLSRPQTDKTFGTTRYTITLAVDSETAERLAEHMSKPGKKNEDGTTTIKITSKATLEDGTVKLPIRVVDINKEPITDIVGDGSRVRVLASTYENKFGKFLGLNKVQVLELVPYARKETEESGPIDFPQVENDDESAF